MYRHEFEEVWKANSRITIALQTHSKSNSNERCFSSVQRARLPSENAVWSAVAAGTIACLDYQKYRWRQMLNNLRVIHRAATTRTDG